MKLSSWRIHLCTNKLSHFKLQELMSPTELFFFFTVLLLHSRRGAFVKQQLLSALSGKQIWLNEAVSSSSLWLKIRTTWWIHSHEHTLAVNTDDTEIKNKRDSQGFCHVYRHCLVLISSPRVPDTGIVLSSKRMQPPFVAGHAYMRAVHDTFSPQEKPWARTGRKTLENQDTIWHLRSLNDFLLGVGLCPTGKTQKTGRENYIRENVYAAHLALSHFLACKLVIIRLLLTSE